MASKAAISHPGRLPDLLTGAGMRVAPYTAPDAVPAAEPWLELPVVTTDRLWFELDREVAIECMRPA